jgi:hypothetical protein
MARRLEEWEREMARAVGTDVLRDIVRDNAGHGGVPSSGSSMIPRKPGEPPNDVVQPRGSAGHGWCEPRAMRTCGGFNSEENRRLARKSRDEEGEGKKPER